ncbi:ligase-associated DNA damage response endonuclease PdeM [Maritimibacter sp. DP1N21-5]|uniref:ligase-associated DNA damage response endonuclease PdeM n=1 Tax=Maritimibacter sp. DP1N21-5 TaxID=2836867 RepID=UPI001C439597|nr:ligase-associated DNA damage response endonuclease PdeM [Maritimibacter sp. DP1N21-5]MBV7410590.1 ligase-associated DNA damage response endonuclease PdeM [Maritimibacter sp. DP1N21-5]
MNTYSLSCLDVALTVLPSGALYWPEKGVLVVSDLHLGRSERFARRAGALLPPYEVQDTLTRLEADIETVAARVVICLGDTFDDDAAVGGLDDDLRLWIARLMAGRRWIWVEGNHDPAPVDLGGEHRAEVQLGPLIFRHIAQVGAQGEVSGHYHPKARVAGRSRPCLLSDGERVILPAYGTYTGGLRSTDKALARLLKPGAIAVLTGANPVPIPMPR